LIDCFEKASADINHAKIFQPKKKQADDAATLKVKTN
jgi:hypothetical protein